MCRLVQLAPPAVTHREHPNRRGQSKLPRSYGHSDHGRATLINQPPGNPRRFNALPSYCRIKPYRQQAAALRINLTCSWPCRPLVSVCSRISETTLDSRDEAPTSFVQQRRVKCSNTRMQKVTLSCNADKSRHYLRRYWGRSCAKGTGSFTPPLAWFIASPPSF